MGRGAIFVVGALMVGAVLVSSCVGVGPGFPPVGGPGPSQPGGMMGSGGAPGPEGQRPPALRYPLPSEQEAYGTYPGYGPPSGMGGGMMGGQGGMMGGWGGGSRPGGGTITIEQAAGAVEWYLAAYGGGLALKEVMEFQQNFYAEVEEEDTGIHAMELLIDKYTGQVFPEMGPNMMWNTKYGMMKRMMGGYYEGSSPAAKMPVDPRRAEALAQPFLDAQLPGATVGEADTFYGYYTLHTLRGGQIEGMLSVNGYSGQVWYHSWHGPFVQTKEFAH